MHGQYVAASILYRIGGKITHETIKSSTKKRGGKQSRGSVKVHETEAYQWICEDEGVANDGESLKDRELAYGSIVVPISQSLHAAFLCQSRCPYMLHLFRSR